MTSVSKLCITGDGKNNEYGVICGMSIGRKTDML
jgi:hypothetical protein